MNTFLIYKCYAVLYLYKYLTLKHYSFPSASMSDNEAQVYGYVDQLQMYTHFIKCLVTLIIIANI